MLSANIRASNEKKNTATLAKLLVGTQHQVTLVNAVLLCPNMPMQNVSTTGRTNQKNDESYNRAILPNGARLSVACLASKRSHPARSYTVTFQE